jgi:hypothetical protein
MVDGFGVMKFQIVLAALCMAAAPFCLTNCGSSTELTTHNEVSVGQQLSDLQRAHNEGIINESEYNRLKKALIKRYD